MLLIGVYAKAVLGNRCAARLCHVCRRRTVIFLLFYKIIVICTFESYSSCFYVIQPVYKLVQLLLNQNNYVLENHLEDYHSVAKVAYMVE